MSAASHNVCLLYPEAIAKVREDLKKARTQWDFLSSVGGNGPIAEFEKRFASIGAGRYAIALSNCTSALFVALLASGIGPGDEVILPAYTWPQTLSPVILAGATPVFADIVPNSVMVDPESIAGLISDKTKAIIAVHLYGIPCEMDKLQKIAKEFNCVLISDAAQGFGSLFKDKPIGAFGDFVAFSFGRSKLFSIGEGGVLACRNRDFYERAIAGSQHPLRTHKEIDDLRRRDLIDGVSMNFRMHPIIASLALGQLEGLLRSRRCGDLRTKFKAIYRKIGSIGETRILPALRSDFAPSGVAFPLNTENSNEKERIARVLRELNLEIYEGGLTTPLHLRPTIQLQPSLLFQNFRANIGSHQSHKIGSCPNAEKRCALPQLFIKLH